MNQLFYNRKQTLFKLRYIYCFATILISFLLFNCTDGIERKKGYIVKIFPEIFNFIPIKDFNVTNDTISFFTENFELGFQFSVYNKYTDSLLSHIDTVKIKNINDSFSFPYEFIYLIPVEIEYKNLAEKQEENTQRHSFEMNLNGKNVKFHYDFNQYDIVKIKPIKTRTKYIMSLEDKRIWLKYDSLTNPLKKFPSRSVKNSER